MYFKQLGRTNVKLPAIGMGTWEIGGARERDDSRDKEAIKAIRKAIELGIYLIDTAEMYGAGHCEEVVGEAIKPFPRENIFVVSKVWHNHLHHDDVIKAAENSLKRLQTDWIDLYLIHWPNPEVPLIETMQALENLISFRSTSFSIACMVSIKGTSGFGKCIRYRSIQSVRSLLRLFSAALITSS